MNYLALKTRIAANVNRDDMGIYIGDWVNEARDKIAISFPFSFLLTSRTIPLVSTVGRYEYDNSATSSFTATKTSTTITASVGTFAATDVGKYFVWATGIVDKIIAFTSTTQVVVENSGTISSGTTATLEYPRSTGLQLNLTYTTGTLSNKLSYVEPQLFDRLFPDLGTVAPTAYTVRGNAFYVNSSVGSGNFIAKYYEFPHIMINDANEFYIDKKYYRAIIASVTAEAAAFCRDANLLAYWSMAYDKEIERMIAIERGLTTTDSKLRTNVPVAIPAA